MNIRGMKLALALLLVVCVGSVLPAWAQSADSGTMVGTVSDQTGAVVPDVQVTLTDKATNQSRSVTTNDAGRYIFVNVAPGEYDMTFTKAGFASTKAPSQRVKVGLATTVNISLQVGAASVQVEVTSVGTELQTMNATVGNTISGTSLDSLPSMNRDVSTFVSLQPGVSPDGSVAGAVVDQSSFYLDGGNNTNDMDGSMSVYTASFAGDPTGGVANQSNNVAAGPSGVVPTPSDSVEEFKVNTAGQTADFNSSAGAEVKVSTRRGTNAFHGSVYEYYLDNNFSANLWDNNLNGVKVADWHRNRFGFRIGGPLLPNFLGGKTYFFFNYEGYRFPFSESRERAVPSADMRLGLLTFIPTDPVTGDPLPPITYNLNNAPVTPAAGGTPIAANAGCGAFPGGVCDPRLLGVNPLVQQVWSHMPLPNEAVGDCGLSRCDKGGNVTGFRFNLPIPQKSNIEVLRVDHDFGQKWRLMSSFRYFKLKTGTHDEVNIGDLLGGKLGAGTSLSKAPQLPWYLVAGITTNISSTTTNDFHYSFLRNWWAWDRAGDVPQLDTLGGAIEPGGENRDQALIPYNVNTQQTRTRFWDGHDQMFRDDVSMLRGNHLFQFGGTYQHNFNWHQRTDNGGGINYEPVYQLGTSSGAGINVKAYTDNLPNGISPTAWGRDYAEVLGLVSIAQIAYTRTGPNLTLNPKPKTPAFDKSTIPYYNVYFTDTWHLKKTFTLTYGLGWTLEMPPVEANGKQIELVDQANQLIDLQSYMHSRQAAALKGEVFNPQVGFTLVGNSENGRKYPYNPFYGAFSPRIAAAWNPTANTVVRAGYGRIYGRLNGVDLVLVPLLGTGLIQPVQCIGALRAGGGTCAGSSSGADPNTAFRIGTDLVAGQTQFTAPLPAASPTLPQPLFPGVNGIAAGAGEALDPHFRPNVVNSFDFTIQRQLSRKVSMEMGYIGRWIHNEYMPININAVPYMITIGGQSFAKAYAGVSQALGCTTSAAACGANIPSAKLADGTTPNPAYTAYFNSLPQQAFFTATLQSNYCNGSYAGVQFANCTAAVALNEVSNITGAAVWSLYSDLDAGGLDPLVGGFDPNILPRSMMNTPLPGVNGGNGQLTSGVGVNASIGYGNYNAGFVSLKMADWKGLTMQHNFTWSKALGTGASVQATSESTAPDPFNLRTGYGLQGFDRKFVYNFYFVYQPPFFTGQHSFAGHVLGGWTLAPIFTAGSGLPVTVATANGGGQAFGEGDSVNFFGYGVSENAIPVGHVSTGVHKNYVGCSAPCLPNLFADPVAAFNNNFRQPVLGFDTRDGGFGVIRGLGYWNMDVSIKKNLKITERLNLEFSTVIANVFNHVNFFDPGPGSYLDTSIGPDPTAFGTLPGQATSSMAYGPRQFEFGLRVSF